MAATYTAEIRNRRGDIIDSRQAETRVSAALSLWAAHPDMRGTISTARGNYFDVQWHSVSELSAWRAELCEVAP